MKNFARALPFIKPFRRKLILSIIFGMMIALLGAFNLLAIFPLSEVMLYNLSFQDYVDENLANSTIAERQLKEKVHELDSKINEIDLSTLSGAQREKAEHDLVHYRQDLAEEQSDLSSESRMVMVWSWIHLHIAPIFPEDKFDAMVTLFGCMLLVTLLKGFLMVTQEVVVGNAVELATINLRKKCFRKVLGLDYQTVSQRGAPELTARFTNDLNIFSFGLRQLGGKAIREPLKALVCLTLAFVINWRLTLLSLIMAPFLGLAIHRISKMLKRAVLVMRESMSRIYKTLDETFTSTKLVIACNGQAQHRRRFHRENKAYYQKVVKMIRIDAFTKPTTEVLVVTVIFMSLLPGMYLVLRDTNSIWGIQLSAEPMAITSLIGLCALMAGVVNPIRKMATTLTKLKQASLSAERVFELLDTESLVPEPEEPVELSRCSQSLQFHKIDFSYDRSKKNKINQTQVLEGIELEVNAGETIVLVGETGSGKSTLTNMLLRYFDPDYGQILIDGIDITEVRTRDLRAQIGILTQDPILFDTTIYENIRYSKPEAGSDEILQAAITANVLEFAEQFDEGLHTQVGDKGTLLTTGQRQRIALARIILNDPSILILDEPTASLDSDSEESIFQTLEEFRQDRTLLWLTCMMTPDLLKFANRVAVLDRGKLIAEGPHETLILSCPVYQKLFQTQKYKQATEDSEPFPTQPVYEVEQSVYDQIEEEVEGAGYLSRSWQEPEDRDEDWPETEDSGPTTLRLHIEEDDPEESQDMAS